MDLKWGDQFQKDILKSVKRKLRLHGFYVHTDQDGHQLEVSRLPFWFNRLRWNGDGRFSIICHNYSYGGRQGLLEIMDRIDGEVFGYIEPSGILTLIKFREKTERRPKHGRKKI